MSSVVKHANWMFIRAIVRSWILFDVMMLAEQGYQAYRLNVCRSTCTFLGTNQYYNEASAISMFYQPLFRT